MRTRLIFALYSLLLRAMLPLLLLRLYWRSRREPAYRQHIGQRLGYYRQPLRHTGAVWLHAVSLGEMRTAGLLLARWRAQTPALKVLLTCSTATGWAEGQRLRDAHTDLLWLPWDMPGSVQRFLRHTQPQLGLVLETEVWPHLVQAAHQAQLPLYLINARLSAKSLRQAQRLATLAHNSYSRFSGVLAQSPADAERLQRLHAPVLASVGNIKFDIDIAEHWSQLAQRFRVQWAEQRPIIALASAREGEEAAFLQAWAEASAMAEAIPLLIPRHPQRFDTVAQLARAAGWQVLRRANWSQHTGPLPARSLLLGDSLGEMPLYYHLSQVALLGGSFLPYGGQNLIEALACYCPVVLGPHTYNFAEASELALAAGLAQAVPDMTAGLQAALTLSQQPPPDAAFQALIEQSQGAIARTLALLPQDRRYGNTSASAAQAGKPHSGA